MPCTPKEALTAALSLFRDGANWVQGNGDAPDPYDAYTALYFATAHQMTPRYQWRYHDQPEVIGIRALLDVIGLSKVEDLISWNDDPSATWESVRDAFQKAIQFA